MKKTKIKDDKKTKIIYEGYGCIITVIRSSFGHTAEFYFKPVDMPGNNLMTPWLNYGADSFRLDFSNLYAVPPRDINGIEALIKNLKAIESIMSELSEDQDFLEITKLSFN